MTFKKNSFAKGFVLPDYDVVVPCFNRVGTIERAVRSLLSQSPPPSRIILVDDGSTDGTATLLLTLERRHANVHAAILPRNTGASAARNAGVGLARADWIAFLDSDDEWVSGAAQALLEATPGHDVIVGHFQRVWKSGIIDAPECGWSGSDILAALAMTGVVGPSWSLMRRSVVLAVDGFDPSYHNCNDWDFFVRLAAIGSCFVRVDATIAHYHIAASNRLSLDTISAGMNADRVRANLMANPQRSPASDMRDFGPSGEYKLIHS